MSASHRKNIISFMHFLMTAGVSAYVNIWRTIESVRLLFVLVYPAVVFLDTSLGLFIRVYLGQNCILCPFTMTLARSTVQTVRVYVIERLR